MSDKAPSDLVPETSLLRLFRCMNAEEQEALIRNALQALGERCSLNPNYARYSPEAIQEELQDENLDGRLMHAWPGGWPGQQVVELDNVGDPGDWLEQRFENVVACLFGFEDDQSLIECLVFDYLREMRDKGIDLPSDFGDEPNPDGWTADDENQVRAEFAAFLRHWRERILKTLEKQNGAKKGEGA